MRKNSKRNTTKELAYIGLFVAVMTVCSWINIPTAVPFTMQTFGVFIIVTILGLSNGLMALMAYILLGAVGVPVFSNFGSGLGVILGPTGGYILGFLLIVLVAGSIIKKCGRSVYVMVVAMSAGMGMCYMFGTFWFVMYYANSGSSMSLKAALISCVIPFVIPDMAKMALAIFIDRKVGKHLRK